jgi:UDP-N-acetylmuramate--alanine ligase
VARHLDLPLDGIAAALSRFQGTRRRMEFKGGDAARSIAVYDDYAHHPTEIRVNLAALRALALGASSPPPGPRRRLRCVFQPHTYSRTRDLLEDFARCFGDADDLVLTEIYAARESDTLGISGADLAAAVRRAGGTALFCPTLAEAAAYVTRTLAPGDVVVTMGAGDVGAVADEVVQCLR